MTSCFEDVSAHRPPRANATPITAQGRAHIRQCEVQPIALTRGRPYKVILDPNTPTGCCDFTNKQILINPNLFSDAFEQMGFAGAKLDEANFLVSRAITGHEALHTLYSDPAVVLSASSNPDLKMALNLLEDAKIEKIPLVKLLDDGCEFWIRLDETLSVALDVSIAQWSIRREYALLGFLDHP